MAWKSAPASAASAATGGRLTAGKKWDNGIEALISGSFDERDGNETLRFDGLGVARNLDYSRKHSLFASVSIGDFTLQAAHSSREKGSPAAAYQTVFNDPQTQLTDRYSLVSLKYEKTFGDDLNFLARAHYADYSYDGVFPYGPGVGTNLDSAHGAFGALELLFGKKLLNKHQLTFGLEARQIFHADQHSYYNSPDSTFVDDSRSETEFATFAQGDFALHRTVKVNLGARLDFSERGGTLLSPRLGLIWTPSADTSLKLIAGQAYRAANAYEAHYYNESHYHEEPIPKPESTQSYEVVLEQKLASAWQFKISGYTGRASRLIASETEPDGDSHFVNTDRVTFRGIETELRGKFYNGIETRLGYSVQRTENAGGKLSNSPQHLGKFQISAPLFGEKLSIGLDVFASSSVATLAGQNEDPFWVANLHLLSVNALPGLELSAGVYNLFDTEYAHPSSGDHPLVDRIPQDGRTFGLKGTYKF